MELWELLVREACRDTLAQYTHAGDRSLFDDYAAAFCEDGILEIRGRAPVQGRTAIIERVRAATAPPAGTPTPTPTRTPTPTTPTSAPTTADTARRIVRHSVTNIRFESVSPEEATVASYFTVFTHIGLDHMGRYRDRLVPVGDRWLIAHRFVSTDWRAPGSIYSRTPATGTDAPQ